MVSLLVVGLAIVVGVPLGAIAGYRRGRIDGLIMRTTDLFLAFPPLLLAMAIVAALGPGLEHAAMALVISWWPWYTRIARAMAVSLREQPFVDAARAIGVPDATVIRAPHRAQLARPDRGPGDRRHRHRHPGRRAPSRSSAWARGRPRPTGA